MLVFRSVYINFLKIIFCLKLLFPFKIIVIFDIIVKDFLSYTLKMNLEKMKNFAGINFCGLENSKHFAVTNFRGFRHKTIRVIKLRISNYWISNINQFKV